MRTSRIYMLAATSIAVPLMIGAIYLAGATLPTITTAVAAETPAAPASIQEPLSIKDRDIRKAARLAAAINICDGKGTLGLQLKVDHAYGQEAGDRMMDIYREILTDLGSKARASETISIAANGIFAKPKFNECEEAKKLANQD